MSKSGRCHSVVPIAWPIEPHVFALVLQNKKWDEWIPLSSKRLRRKLGLARYWGQSQVRMEVAGCDASCSPSCADCGWEECVVVADSGDTYDVRIVSDGELCNGVPRSFVRVRSQQEAEAEVEELAKAAEAEAKLARAKTKEKAAMKKLKQPVSDAPQEVIGARMEAAGCDERCPLGCTECEWEECEIMAVLRGGSKFHVRIVSDGTLIRGISRHHLRPLERHADVPTGSSEGRDPLLPKRPREPHAPLVPTQEQGPAPAKKKRVSAPPLKLLRLRLVTTRLRCLVADAFEPCSLLGSRLLGFHLHDARARGASDAC